MPPVLQRETERRGGTVPYLVVVSCSANMCLAIDAHYVSNMLMRQSGRAGPQLVHPMAATKHLNLLPPLVPHGGSEELLASGQAIAATASPADNTWAVFTTTVVSVQATFANACQTLTILMIRNLWDSIKDRT